MCAGTVRMGEISPGAMRPSRPLWQRLYLRPEPHQQSSFDWGRTAGALARVRGVGHAPDSFILKIVPAGRFWVVVRFRWGGYEFGGEVEVGWGGYEFGGEVEVG